MATLPPRKNPTPTKISKQHLTPLQTLLQLGFPKHRAEKALAATGHRGVQLASDWLLAHVRDPTLDSDTQRQYVLYACPIGPLAKQLELFWSESKELGWNGAHNFIPHITLVSFFKASDELTEELANILEDVVYQDRLHEHIELETYVSPNFMGFFVKDINAEWLKNIAIRYVNKVAPLGIIAEPQVTPLHLTLAYQFPSNLFQSLSSAVEKLGPNTPANWELRLYSRDLRLQNLHVHKVTHAHVPREHDELELRVGDYIYVPEGACNASTDGWVEGISWLTGISGYLPLNHTKRTAESDSWTLHTTVMITDNKRCESAEEEEVPRIRRPPPVLSPNESIDTTDGIPAAEQLLLASEVPLISSREIFICRHGERVDFTFGSWIPYCFESDGCYVRRDLNMPKEIPSRNIQDFQNDCPLTTVGEVQASLVGEAMKSANIKIDVAFASPSLRCIQTLAHILKGLKSDVPIKVEPGLIEWLAWYPNGIPVWMTSEELIKAGFNVDADYDPIVKANELPLKENAAQYYERSYDLIKKIIDYTDGNILIVAHAASLAACTRQLTGGRIPPAAEVTRLVQRVPYLACLTARQGLDGWQLHPPPFPPITHTSNSRFDWKVLTS
ncbi:protein UBASH3A homolog [Harpegnathos saltator]|uniref:Ecdysteroid-phosphate phosphatase n=1 Tax=Harpegnathos saltator TaxID=610380 RepID=E2B6H3_HARSA|nr:protein UBASH3A homolog [Harpegnathos saltator]XP_011151955.1 protein UBASH3A homolog [Harpegnathos saltator]EFN88717.1 Ubiquitin associated and SH3 domain-containing protein B [Harpegnathos saltator]